MCPGSRLVGPPEIRDAPPQTSDDPVSTEIGDASPPVSDEPAEKPTGEPFLDVMDSSFNASSETPRGLTENLSATFLSSGNPCLDFFFKVVPDTPATTVIGLLTAAWKHDPLTALKLVCNLRGVRGTGKADKEGFYTAALWLHAHHPKTLALNVGSLAEFGYMKDLPEILHRLIDGADTREIAKDEHEKFRRAGRRGRSRFYSGKAKKGNAHETEKKIGTRDERIAAELTKVKIEIEKARKQRHEKKTKLAIRAVDRYASDPAYQFLHDRISEFFAKLLASDLEQLNKEKFKMIGLAAKWCPSLDSCFDRTTLLCESIARRLFPKESNPEYAEIEERHYAYRVRDRLRREVLVPLRKVLELPEIFMSSRQWNDLPYNRVASVAMNNYKDTFKKHDNDRFSNYLEDVKKGKAKIAAGALLPHEILAAVCKPKDEDGDDDDDVAELQWARMVQDVLKLGKLNNCIAVCDVSGSMSGTPMEVCVAMGILISELSEEPWKGRVITFSDEPQLHKITGNTLREKSEFVREMNWGMNTDFQKVFDQILQVAVQGNLPPEQMIKRVFVFSDMEFDRASKSSWETDYEVICSKFQASGYGEAIPEIVFWNLRDSSSVPVTANQKAVALVSGFSKNLVKLFLEGGGIVNPVAIMDLAISGKEYGKLVVFD
ncbi:vWA-like protein [Dioscorea alata]|uniref:VWA-like protein n=1 Tax=Dioscorea alata TaxID=55571 RepID=A0ACB7VUF3_DIOAL|nr:vWA-like protein [Dioscorea alata]